MQDLEGLRGELEEFERLETDRERFPTVSVKCDPGNFREKLRYVVRNYGGFNLQWGGYTEHLASWRALSEELRGHAVWCNVVGILNRAARVTTPTGEKVRTSGVARPLMYGGHSYCFAWPHVHPAPKVGRGGAPQRREQRAEVFNAGTWGYDPSALDYSAARTMSFNAIQDALGQAREEIAAGTLYSRLCPRMPGLDGTLARLPGSA